MHRQTFFSLLVAVIALCVAMSAGRPAPISESNSARALLSSKSKSKPAVAPKPDVPPPTQPKPVAPIVAKPKPDPATKSKTTTSAAPTPTPKSTTHTNSTTPATTGAKSCPIKKKPTMKTKPRTLQGRATTEVCGVSIRGNVDCTGRPSFAMTLTRRSDKGSDYVPGQSGSSGSDSETEDVAECEHALELQLLKYAFEKSGLCDALDTLTTASGYDKATYLADVKTAINQPTNLYNVGSKTNAAKNQMTQQFIRGNGSPTTIAFDADKLIFWNKVKSYITSGNPPVATNARTLAASIDTKATALINTATTDAVACGMTQANANTAKAKFHPGATWTLTKVWSDYVAFVTRQAALTS